MASWLPPWCHHPWVHVGLIVVGVAVVMYMSNILYKSVDVSSPPVVNAELRHIEELVREAKRLQEVARTQLVTHPIQAIIHLTTAITLIHTALHLLPLNYNNTTALSPLQQLNNDLLREHDGVLETLHTLLPHYPRVQRFVLF